MSPREITKAITHLKFDKNLRKIIERSARPKFSKGQDPFEFLVRSIIYQQLSGKSAGAILKRVHALFKDNKPIPQKVKKLESRKFKSCGLSRQKIIYLKELPNAKKMEGLAEDWRPYRTIASLYLWKSIDTNDSNW